MKKTIYDNEYKIFVRRLKKARKDTGLTQVQVAKKLGSTQAYISKVESCQLRVDVTQLKKFAMIYKKDANYFLK